MHDARVIPQDLESCQQLLQAAWAEQTELTDACTVLQNEQEKLRQQNEEQHVTIQHLLRQLYGRRSERFVEGQGQQHFAFDLEALDPSLLSAANEDPVIQEILVQRRKHRKRRSEKLPDHLPRRTERIEPTLPEGIALEDCQLIGIDVVEVPEFQRGKLWVRRFEYPKYKVPTSVASPKPTAGPWTEAESEAATASLVEVGVAVASESMEPSGGVARVSEIVNASSSVEDTDTQRPRPETPAEPTESNGPPGPAFKRVISSGAVVNSQGIIQAPRMITLVEGGNFGFSIAAQVLFEKFGQHVPLYRQQDSLAQLGWSPNRSTLGLIVQNAAELFVPLADLFRQRLLGTDILGTDDTWVTLLTPREGDGSRKARFWLYRENSKGTGPY